MRRWMVLASLVIAPGISAQQSLEHKACLFGAAEKLPNIAGMAVTDYRFVSPPGDPKAKARESSPLAVEIDATFLGTTGTFLFVCASQLGGHPIVFPRGLIR